MLSFSVLQEGNAWACWLNTSLAFPCSGTNFQTQNLNVISIPPTPCACCRILLSHFKSCSKNFCKLLTDRMGTSALTALLLWIGLGSLFCFFFFFFKWGIPTLGDLEKNRLRQGLHGSVTLLCTVLSIKVKHNILDDLVEVYIPEWISMSLGWKMATEKVLKLSDLIKMCLANCVLWYLYCFAITHVYTDMTQCSAHIIFNVRKH